ncbi:hypothetical protein LTR15_006872 [Elasticomyces elasticus]|nr:hypothetical protein LTR15_006872 [Elasticomyces elasticus]
MASDELHSTWFPAEKMITKLPMVQQASQRSHEGDRVYITMSTIDVLAVLQAWRYRRRRSSSWAAQLTKDNKYAVRILTRDPNGRRAQELAKLPNVELLKGNLDNAEQLRQGLKGCWGASINIDGFVVGQKTEVFWGIRTYQLAQEAGIKFYVWGNLDYVARESGYDPAVQCGHFDAKSVIGDWVLSQDKWHTEHASEKAGMRSALFTTGPYLDMCLSAYTAISPNIASDGAVEWRLPLKQGAIATIALEDCGRYVRWLFDNAFDSHGQPGRAAGLDLAVATQHARFDELAKAFTKITGKPARFVDVSEEEYFAAIPGSTRNLRFGQAYAGMKDDDQSMMTFEENFRGFWRIWQLSGGDKPLIRRDYAFLDEILPGRIKSVEEWLEKHKDQCMEVADGKMEAVLKVHEDKAMSSIRI